MGRPKSEKPLRDITGQKFGQLEVLRMAPPSDLGGWKAICKCHLCGRTDYVIRPSGLKASHTGTCGCDRSYFDKMTGEKSLMFKGYAGLNSYYVSNAFRRAREKKLEFDLDAKFLWELYEKQLKECALSHIPITMGKKNRERHTATASLDRIDSDLGYLKTNVQWVHKDVNLMKMYLKQDYFVEMCGKITLVQNERNRENSKNHAAY